MDKQARKADYNRATRETDIKVSLNLDGEGVSEISTPIGFFNHMLELFAKHSGFDLKIQAKGDIQVDYHHTIEDIGICLGLALKKALNNKTGINRYGSVLIPMDETLAQIVVDISGRPYLVFDVKFNNEKVGDFDTELVEEFFRAFCYNAQITLHVRLVYGFNTHHIIEALFKGLGRGIAEAVAINPKTKGVPSTKGVL
ncbi:MAG: imidazoleglycerol-phosphate dehydratase [Thermosediminibacterales bacterium]|nr:imidazoleglycerol-phosphate dehydratase [Thermosediminibacterales bacterium]MDK2835906.1 imidazoleglycerol-phosphate dehydratase [Thermosediminibacterales bacterium]